MVLVLDFAANYPNLPITKRGELHPGPHRMAGAEIRSTRRQTSSKFWKETLLFRIKLVTLGYFHEIRTRLFIRQ